MASQNDDWTPERVARWLSQADALDRQLHAVTQLLFDCAHLTHGERVLDIGCGSGPTTRLAATAVGPTGWVGGVDVAAGMLEAAATVPPADPAAPIEWIEADVVDWHPSIEPVDVVISRFGVMFFRDPAAAFANLAGVTRPGGRLCAMTWDRRDRTEMFQVPMKATIEVLRAAGREIPELPVDEGAFSLSDPGHVIELLEGAGWADVVVEQHDVRLPVGGGQALRGAAESAIGIGPSRVLTSDIDEDLREQVVLAIENAFAPHLDDNGHVVLGGSVMRLIAQRPG